MKYTGCHSYLMLLIMLAVGCNSASAAGLGEGSGAGRESLPLGTLCDGSPEAFYDERLFEPADCWSGQQQMPTPRLESAPRFDSPFLSRRCEKPLAFQKKNERFECAEIEFFLGFYDGRLLQRQHGIEYLSSAITLAESETFKSEEFKRRLARLYTLRAIGKMGVGVENGRLDYLLFGDLHSGVDFERVKQLDPENSVPAKSFEISMELTKARMSGDEETAIQKAWEILELAETAGNPDELEPINVGLVMTIMGIIGDFPLYTGLPQAILDAMIWAYEGINLPGIPYSDKNTDKGPFVLPGLQYSLATAYARVGKRDEYIAQLEVVAQQPGYQDWAWFDFVEAQRANPERLLEKYASFGEDKYSDSYATSNNACVFCHGGI